MTITRADAKQEEFISSRGKLFINFEQVEKTETVDENQITYWEMKTLEVEDARDAYQAVIEYYEAQQSRPLRELAVDPVNEYALNKLKFLEEQIAKYR